MSNAKTLHLQWMDGEIEVGTLIDALYEQERTIAMLREHKNDYMDAAEGTRKYLEAELAKLRAGQEPVGYADITSRSFAKYKSAMHCLPLYAAPVGEREDERAQQPQSADSLIVTVVDPDSRRTTEYVITESVVLSLWRRIEELERRKDVVMPERKDEKGVHGAALMSAIAHNLCLDEFARLNGKEVGRG